MKKPLLCGAILLMAASILPAQTPASSPDSPAPLKQGRSGGPRAAAKVMAEMKTKLSLTDDQVQKITPLLEQRMKDMKALRENKSIGRLEKMQQFRSSTDAYNQKLDTILTPEQRTKQAAFQKEMTEKMKQRRAEKQAAAAAPSATP
ncbi:MAG: hypothetical protein ABI443_05455 [Chthoniobacterales bacterium]